MARVRGRFGAAALAAVAAAFIPDSSAAADNAPEYAVKAAYLSKLGLFVEWPKSVFPSPDSALVLCVAGENPFGNTLEKIVQGQRIGERPVTVRYLKTVERDSGCGILYIGGANGQSVMDILKTVNGTGVLTVTDESTGEPAGARAPGIIDFVVQDNRVRFRIDEHAASENGITISFHLLGLALSVRAKE